jgi:F420-dependent methylenetetrahydromethanopterin dehydrogenase
VDCGYHIVGMKAEDAPDIAVAVRPNNAVPGPPRERDG